MKYLLLALIAFLAVSGVAWQFRNPRGNPATYWLHFDDAIQFHRLPQYQDAP